MVTYMICVLRHYSSEFASSRIVRRLRVLLPQRIMGWNNLLSFCQGWSGVSYAKGDTKGSIEPPFLSI